MKSWLDDFTLYTKTAQEFLIALVECSRAFLRSGLILSAEKYVFNVRQLRWRGRNICRTGFNLDSKNRDALRYIQRFISVGSSGRGVRQTQRKLRTCQKEAYLIVKVYYKPDFVYRRHEQVHHLRIIETSFLF